MSAVRRAAARWPAEAWPSRASAPRTVARSSSVSSYSARIDSGVRCRSARKSGSIIARPTNSISRWAMALAIISEWSRAKKVLPPHQRRRGDGGREQGRQRHPRPRRARFGRRLDANARERRPRRPPGAVERIGAGPYRYEGKRHVVRRSRASPDAARALTATESRPKRHRPRRPLALGTEEGRPLGEQPHDVHVPRPAGPRARRDVDRDRLARVRSEER